MSNMEYPFCGKRLPTASTRCWYCYKSLMFYYPAVLQGTPDPIPSVGTRPVTGHAMWLVRFGVLVVGVALLFLVIAR